VVKHPLNLLGNHSPAINKCIGFSLACRHAARPLASACKFVRSARHTARPRYFLLNQVASCQTAHARAKLRRHARQFFWPKKQASNFKPWCHSIGSFPINTEPIGTTPSYFLHAFSYTMVEPNTGFVFDLNEHIEDDPVDPNAPVDWDAIAEDVFNFDVPLFHEQIEEGQFLVSFF
jgi:hypothetical protein